MRNKLPVVMFLTIFLMAAGSAFGQKQLKPWKEWSKNDAQKILNDSPWAHLQVDQDFVEATPLTRPPDPSVDTRLRQNDGMTYGIRFFSARPIRQGVAGRRGPTPTSRLCAQGTAREITPFIPSILQVAH